MNEMLGLCADHRIRNHRVDGYEDCMISFEVTVDHGQSDDY